MATTDFVEGSTRNFAFDMRRQLDSGEKLTGTPTITEVGTSDLTITNKTVSNASLVINGRTVPASQAVQCTISGAQAGTTYTIKVSVGTDSTPAQTLVETFDFECVAAE